jgi:hypothetical protein
VVRVAGLPQRSALAQSQRADRQAGLQHAAPRDMRPKPAARAEQSLLFGHDPAPREMRASSPRVSPGPNSRKSYRTLLAAPERAVYRVRNLVERFFNKIGPCRRDKLAANCLAFMQLASIRALAAYTESTT